MQRVFSLCIHPLSMQLTRRSTFHGTKPGRQWKRYLRSFHPTCLDVLSICFRLLSLCGQVELANGASAEDLLNNRYYDAEAIHFIEEVCTFLTLDAAHRQVVSPPRPKHP